jgi:hypothetical protein
MLKKTIIFTVILLAVGLAVVSAQDTARLQQLAREIEQLTADFQAGKITAQEFQRRALEMQNQITAENQNMQQSMEQTSSSFKFTDVQMRRLLELFDQNNRIKAQQNEGRITEVTANRQLEPIKREIEQIQAPFKNLSREQSVNIGQQTEELERQIKQLWPGNNLGMPPNDFFQRRNIPQLTISEGLRVSWNGESRGFSIYINGADERLLEQYRREIETKVGGTMQRANFNDYSLLPTDGLNYALDIPDGSLPNGSFPEYSVRLTLGLKTNWVDYTIRPASFRTILGTMKK